jgi:DNA-binding NarL/FixJ family response regulator
VSPDHEAPASATLIAQLVDQPSDELPRNHRLATGGSPDNCGKSRQVELVRQISARPRPHCCKKLSFLRVPGQHDYDGARDFRNERADDPQTDLRIEIQEADIRPMAENVGDQALLVGNLEALGLRLQSQPKAHPRGSIVGRDEDSRPSRRLSKRAQMWRRLRNVGFPVYDQGMRVLVADDHKLILEGIKRALDEAEDFEVVGECSSGSQVLPMVGRTNPDLVLLDLRMPGADGLACLSQIRKRHPDVKVVVLSVSTDENVIQTVLKRGASAYIVKSINPIDLPSALRQAVEGTVYSAIGMPDNSDSPARAAGLTERETAILSALARGLSNEAIGKELWVAEQTVKFHLTNIYRKLGVSNRTEAARLAYQNGLVDSPLSDH